VASIESVDVLLAVALPAQHCPAVAGVATIDCASAFVDDYAHQSGPAVHGVEFYYLSQRFGKLVVRVFQLLDYCKRVAARCDVAFQKATLE